MPIVGFDHVAIPTRDPDTLIQFYGRLGFRVPDPREWAESKMPFFSMFFGNQKINVHSEPMWSNPEFTLRGPTALPGCGDLCFVWDGGAEALHSMLNDANAPIIAGPIELHGARGKGVSVYVRDPDENLLEFIIYE